MNLYVDSSALVKLYVLEKESGDVERWIAGADQVWTSIVTYAEVCAGLARRARERSLTATDHQRVLSELNRDWPHLDIVLVDQAVTRVAGVLAARHALRGFDAIHLASALHVEVSAGPLQIAVFDHRLRQGAAGEKLLVLGS